MQPFRVNLPNMYLKHTTKFQQLSKNSLSFKTPECNPFRLQPHPPCITTLTPTINL